MYGETVCEVSSSNILRVCEWRSPDSIHKVLQLYGMSCVVLTRLRCSNFECFVVKILPRKGERIRH